MTTYYNKTDGHSPTTRNLTQFTEDTESASAQTTIPTNIHTANRIYTNIILMADKHTIPKGTMHSNCRLLPDDIVCKITQRNNIRRTNTCDPALKLLNEEITSDIQNSNKTYGRDIYTLTGIKGTTHPCFGRPYMIYPIELLRPHLTGP